jgi:sec-independent protein translocase protein TatB
MTSVVELSPAKILVVLVVALVVLGPDKLPRVARQAGRLVNDLRKVRDGLNAEVREAFGDPGGIARLPTLSNLPAQGRAWVSSVTSGASPSTTAPSSTTAQPTVPLASQPSSGSPPGEPPPSVRPSPAVSSGGPPAAGSKPSGERPDGEDRDGDGGFDPRFN